MHRQLYLLRHSYTEPPGERPDIERMLTLKGMSTVRALGNKLSEDGFNPDLIKCSAAVRTTETAIHLVEELDMNESVISYEDKIYNASVRELLEVIREADAQLRKLLLIGHNPSISFLGEYLTGAHIGGLEPCGLVTIRFEGIAWEEASQGSGSFVSYYHPDH